jgi:putative intracellular protease/amidase
MPAIMKSIRLALFSGVAGLIATSFIPVHAEVNGKVLVVLSSASHLDLKDGKRYETGYFLNELAIPLQTLSKAGYTPVFADPDGNAPVMDAHSNDVSFFAGNDNARAEALAFVNAQEGLKHPLTLASVAKSGIDGYAAVFIPGGHAPVQDLPRDGALGKILTAFHNAGKPTGIICHGPVAVLSTLAQPAAFLDAVKAGDVGKARRLSTGFAYQGYRMTVFATSEEKQVEGPGKQLGGSMPFYLADALEDAGAKVTNGPDWKSYVVEDRELITGQQPFSDAELAKALIRKLEAAR